MRTNISVLLACQLSRSGFSGERVFRVTTASNEEYVGVAPVDSCMTSEMKPLGPDAPAQNNMEGFVEGRLVQNGGETAMIALPDGDTVTVHRSRILYQVPGDATYVPVGS